MFISTKDRHVLAFTLAFGMVTLLAGCGEKEPPATSSTAAPTPEVAAVPAVATTAASGTWTPEAMEELLAPIALYPDPVLSQVLIASTNPQEVLDAGNWLLQNEGVKGKCIGRCGRGRWLHAAGSRRSSSFPATVDMMCLEMEWTTELGQAFTADQAGVLDAVQRLRKQAKEVGNLESSSQMLVETEVQEGQEVVVLKPPKPDVVYVPQYDPQTAYAPAPAAPITATTTTTTAEPAGHSTASMVTTGVLAFGAGILVSELLDDDDNDNHHHDYYYPNYGHGGMPYYPPYPYRPAYGNGHYPSNGYNRPPNYNSGFQNTGNIYINTGDKGSGNNYWDRYDSKARPGSGGGGTYNRARTGQSPITAARPNRAELQDLSKRQPRPMPANVRPPSQTATAANWKGQSGYAGKANKSGSTRSAEDRIAQATPAYSRPASGKASTSPGQPKPKVQGSYAGARDDSSQQAINRAATGSRDTPKASPDTGSRDNPKPRPDTGAVQRANGGDRGYDTNPQREHTNRSSPKTSGGRSEQQSTAMSGANRGSTDRAASQRGKQSMPQGARSKGGGHGGKKKER